MDKSVTPVTPGSFPVGHPQPRRFVVLGRRVAVVLASSAVVALAGSPVPASAEVAPAMSILIKFTTPSSYYHQVCISGSVQAAAVAQWVVTITGSRSDGDPINVQDVFINDTEINRCYTVDKYGTDTGAYTVLFEYLGVGDEVPDVREAVGGWQSATGRPDFRFDSLR